VKKVVAQILPELRAIGLDTDPQLIEHLDRHDAAHSCDKM
jgi:hypothetical protein